MSESSSLVSVTDETPRTVSKVTLDKLKQCPGFVDVDPRLLQQFAESITTKNDVGYFLKDISCQTEESSITDLNNMIKIIQNLLKEIAVVKRNLLFAKQLLHADYDAKIGGRAMDLYCSINDRLNELEKLYEDKIKIARRSFKTQLADACKKIAGDYKQYYAKLLALETGQSGSILQDLKDTISKQAKMLKIQEQNLSALRSQLAEAETRINVDAALTYEDSDDGLKADTPPPPPEPDFLSNTIDPDEHKKVIEEKDKLTKRCNALGDEVLDCNGKIKRLEARLKLVRDEGEQDKIGLEDQVKKLKEEVDTLKDENEKLVIKSQQVKKVAFIQEKSPTPPATPAPAKAVVIPEGSNKSSAEIDALIKEEVQKVRTELMIKFKNENEELLSQNRQALIAEQEKRAHVEKILQSQQDMSNRDNGAQTLRHLQKLEEEQRTEIARLNKELDRTTLIYEKKLSVLHNTMINLKNEVFMRNLLHRQAAQLHHATLTYSTDSPVSYMGSHEHGHKRFPERHAPLRSIHPNRPPTVFTEVFMRNLLHRQAAQLHHATLTYSTDSPVSYMGSHEHGHKRFPERHAPLRSIHPNRPPTVFTENGDRGSCVVMSRDEDGGEEGRLVALIDMDCFYVQVFVRSQPELKGKPVAVLQYSNAIDGGSSAIAVSYEARALGVKRGMRKKEIKEINGDVVCVVMPNHRDKADLTMFRSASSEVMAILAEYATIFERASIDEAYIDITANVKKMIDLSLMLVTHNCATHFPQQYNTYLTTFSPPRFTNKQGQVVPDVYRWKYRGNPATRPTTPVV
eukprot:sb/3462209/